MKHNVLAPSVGESITEVSILKWRKQSGESVTKGDVILEIESDKATVEVIAEATGMITISKQAGERVTIGAILASIDDSVQGTKSAVPQAQPTAQAAAAAPQMATVTSLDAGPAARKMAAETGVNISQIPGTGKDGRVTKGDIINLPSAAPTAAPTAPPKPTLMTGPGDRRVPMSRLRQRIAERLVQAQHTAAILTTFNEVDMSAVMKLRNEHKDAFKTKHGVPLSFMSFFTRGCVEALKLFPGVNASLDGTDVIFHDYADIGIAVGTDRGLVVPVIRNAHTLSVLELEKAMAVLAAKARDAKLSIAEMTGGTFTISNGGTYGSLLSTPILNPPQSGILGMHKIQERPIAVSGKVEIKPMMYLALSYDHRLIDGKEAVSFLVSLKDFLENPSKLNLVF